MQRALGGITLASLQANASRAPYFIRIDLPAPVGTKRFTNYHTSITANVDGVVATWVPVDVKVGRLAQGRQSALTVSSLSFANRDKTWTNWANSPGLRDVEIHVYKGKLNTDGSFLAAIPMYPGKIDNHQCLDRAELALKPWSVTWGRRCMTAIPGQHPLLPADLMPPDGEFEGG